MKKQDEIQYFVTAVASKTEMYRMAAKPGWGAADSCKNPVTRDRPI